MNRITAICFSHRGVDVINTLRVALSKSRYADVTGYAGYAEFEEYDEETVGCINAHGSVKDVVRDAFAEKIPLVFVGACGIAVRYIAPFIKDKTEDIPVLVTDEQGKYVIPILSGHIGGANELARLVAEAVGGEAVITTATDVNETFAIDNFAKENGFKIINKERIKTVSSKVIKGEPIIIAVKDFGNNEKADVVVEKRTLKSFNIQGNALILSPKRYVLGIGTKRGKTLSEIESVIGDILADLEIGYDDIYAFGSIDKKTEEEGLRDFSRKYRLPFFTFTAEMLSRVKGDFAHSTFVNETVGVDNVCERAAVLLSGGGELICKKTAGNGIAFAIAERRI